MRNGNRKWHRGSPGKRDNLRPASQVKAPPRNRLRQLLMHYHPSALLLFTQMILLVLHAFLDGAGSQQYIISAMGIAVLILVVWVVSSSPAAEWLTWILAAPAVVLAVAAAFSPDAAVHTWADVLEGALYLYAAASLIAYMMDDERVTFDELFAAGSTFMLLAWAFAYFYLAAQAWVPESFSSVGDARTFTFMDMLSLSFTNLTATGLSDIIPAAPAARLLIMLEQFAGVGFLAMVVSRLVGLTMQKGSRLKP